MKETMISAWQDGYTLPQLPGLYGPRHLDVWPEWVQEANELLSKLKGGS